MIRLLGIGISLSALLGLIWFCSTNTSAVAEMTTQPAAPQFYPAPTQLAETEPVPTEQTVCQIPYANIIAQRLVCYDGPFLEDEAEEELIGVAALELRNTGDAVVEYVEAVVSQPHRQLRFEATFIPPGCSVLVLEKDAQRYDTGLITDFTCPKVVCMQPQSSSESVCVETDGFCSLKVINLTDKDISCVRVFYKQYYEVDELFLGGITYSLVLPDLRGGESLTLSPYHFATELSRVVAVTVEP